MQSNVTWSRPFAFHNMAFHAGGCNAVMCWLVPSGGPFVTCAYHVYVFIAVQRYSRAAEGAEWGVQAVSADQRWQVQRQACVCGGGGRPCPPWHQRDQCVTGRTALHTAGCFCWSRLQQHSS